MPAIRPEHKIYQELYKKQLMKQREVLREDMFAGIISPRQYRILDEKVRHKLKEWNMANNNRSK